MWTLSSKRLHHSRQKLNGLPDSRTEALSQAEVFHPDGTMALLPSHKLGTHCEILLYHSLALDLPFSKMNELFNTINVVVFRNRGSFLTFAICKMHHLCRNKFTLNFILLTKVCPNWSKFPLCWVKKKNNHTHTHTHALTNGNHSPLLSTSQGQASAQTEDTLVASYTVWK